jgi:hypothetical protein
MGIEGYRWAIFTPKIIFHFENARKHTARKGKAKPCK